MGIWGAHPPTLSTPARPIVNEYREGKVKSTPVRGVKQTLKPSAYKPFEGYVSSLRAFLLNDESASYGVSRGGAARWSRSESECEVRVKWHAVDPKRCDLHMARLKRG